MTRIHLLRHGEVLNPDGVLYGRLPGFHLSERGVAMANRIAETVADRDIVRIVSSPLERAQETAAPIAAKLGLDVRTDDRLTEATNVFQGQRLGGGGVPAPGLEPQAPAQPVAAVVGEPYVELAARMQLALADARAADDREALLVSHQLPIWIVRSAAEGRRLWHDPRSRVCPGQPDDVHVRGRRHCLGRPASEPAADLLPASGRQVRAGA